MSQKVKGIGVPVLILAAVLAVIFLISLNFEQEGYSSDYTVLLDVPERDIQFVLVENPKGSFCIRGGDAYRVDGLAENIPLDSGRIAQLLSRLGSLRGSAYWEDSTSMSFDTKVTVSFSGREYVFQLGSSQEADGFLYLSTGEGAFYAADTQLEFLRTASAQSFVSLTPLPLLEKEQLVRITRLSISGTDRDETIVVEQQALVETGAAMSYEYQVVSPAVYPVSEELLEEVVLKPVGSLAASGVESIVAEEKELQKYGLLSPSYELSFQLGQESYRICFGDITRDAQFYAYLPGCPVIYRIPVSSVVFLQARLPDIVSRAVVTSQPEALQSLTIERSNKTYRFDFNGSGENLKVTSTLAEIDTENFYRFYAILASVMIEGEAEQPQDTPPVVKLTFEYRSGGKSSQIEYIPMADSRRCFCSVNGTGLFYVMNKDVTAMLEAVEKLITGDSLAAVQ